MKPKASLLRLLLRMGANPKTTEGCRKKSKIAGKKLLFESAFLKELQKAKKKTVLPLELVPLPQLNLGIHISHEEGPKFLVGLVGRKTAFELGKKPEKVEVKVRNGNRGNTGVKDTPSKTISVGKLLEKAEKIEGIEKAKGTEKALEGAKKMSLKDKVKRNDERDKVKREKVEKTVFEIPDEKEKGEKKVKSSSITHVAKKVGVGVSEVKEERKERREKRVHGGAKNGLRIKQGDPKLPLTEKGEKLERENVKKETAKEQETDFKEKPRRGERPLHGAEKEAKKTRQALPELVLKGVHEKSHPSNHQDPHSLKDLTTLRNTADVDHEPRFSDLLSGSVSGFNSESSKGEGMLSGSLKEGWVNFNGEGKTGSDRTPLAGEATVKAFIKKLEFNLRERKREATVELHPPELGKVRFKISLGAGKATARFWLPSPEVKLLFENNLHHLHSFFREQGYSLEASLFCSGEMNGDGGNNGGNREKLVKGLKSRGERLSMLEDVSGDGEVLEIRKNIAMEGLLNILA